MNSIFSKAMSFEFGKPVSPLPLGEWPGKNTGTLFWLLRKKFVLDKTPDMAFIRIAADRHYEIFINSVHVATQRNYFNADKYILTQKYVGEDIKTALRKGENRIEILVRSDAFKNKNYICFHPFAWLSMDMDRQILATDESWEVALIENWRTTIAISTTVVHEKVKLRPSDRAGMMGTPPNLLFSPALAVAISALPPFYEWTELPRRKELQTPKHIIASGIWETVGESVFFNMGEIFAESDGEAVLRSSFECSGGEEICIAASALCSGVATFNGNVVAERDILPGESLMRQYNYLSPLCKCRTVKGINVFEVRFSSRHQPFIEQEKERGSNGARNAGSFFGIAVYGLSAAELKWENKSGDELVPKVWTEDIHDRMGAKAVIGALEGLSSNAAATAFSLSDIRKENKPFVILNFDHAKKGRLSFRINAQSSGRIYLSGGFMIEQGSVDCARNGKKDVDIIEVPEGESFYESFDDLVFVYLDMAFEGFNGDMDISEIKIETRVFQDKGDSWFKSSDQLINQLWVASVRTAQLCCDEIYMDNPDREHAQWLDNAHPNIAAGYYVFGVGRKPVKVYDEMIFNQKEDGQLPGYAPGYWGGRLSLQCHMALYFRAIWRHFQYSGDFEMLTRHVPCMAKIIAFWKRYRNTDGLLENLETIFVDWGIHFYSYAPAGIFSPMAEDKKNPCGILTAMNAYYLGSLNITAELARHIGNDSLSNECHDCAEETAAAMRKHLFDRQKGLFRDGIKNHLAENHFSQAANALCSLCGVLPREDGQKILKTVFDGPQPRPGIIPASPHFCFQAGEALFEAGFDDLAVSWLRKIFGPMLETAAGTLWEDQTPCVSHCQGTGAAVAYLLSRYHCGFYPAKPGYEVIGVAPLSCGRSGLRSQLNTPRGLVGVEWTKTSGGFDYRLTLPESLKDRDIICAPGVELTVR